MKNTLIFPFTLFLLMIVNLQWGFGEVGLTKSLSLYAHGHLVSSWFANNIVLNQHLPLIKKTSLLFTVLSALIGGWLSDSIGRKKTLILANIIYFLAIVIFLITNVTLLDICTLSLINGLSSIFLITSIALLVETSPYVFRGRAITLITLSSIAGILFFYISAYYIPYLFNRFDEVRYFFLLFVSFISLFLLPLIPESPRWLRTTKKNIDHDKMSLHWMQNNRLYSKRETRKVEQTDYVKNRRSINLIKLLKQPLTVFILFLGVLYAFMGIEILIEQAPKLFQLSGIDNQNTSILYGALVALMYGLGALICYFLIDRIGKFKLMALSLGGIIVTYLCVNIVSNIYLGNPIDAQIVQARPFVFAFFFGLGCAASFTLLFSMYFPTYLRCRALGSIFILITLTSQVVQFSIHNIKFFYWLSTITALLLFVINTEFFLQKPNLPLEDETFLR